MVDMAHLACKIFSEPLGFTDGKGLLRGPWAKVKRRQEVGLVVVLLVRSISLLHSSLAVLTPTD